MYGIPINRRPILFRSLKRLQHMHMSKFTLLNMYDMVTFHTFMTCDKFYKYYFDYLDVPVVRALFAIIVPCSICRTILGNEHFLKGYFNVV